MYLNYNFKKVIKFYCNSNLQKTLLPRLIFFEVQSFILMSKLKCSSSESDAPISLTPDMQPKDSLWRKDLPLIIYVKLFITSTIKHASRINHCCSSLCFSCIYNICMLYINMKLIIIGLQCACSKYFSKIRKR